MKPYDPLEYGNIGRDIARKLVSQPVQSLPPAKFEGDGVYALYYCGRLEQYRPIRKIQGSNDPNAIPIYVGNAVPGGRKGMTGENATSISLFRRLVQHAGSINDVENLKAEDFECRHLILVPVWIALAEQLLISTYRPIWNVVLDGFGNHAPGKGRKDMRRPDWDIVHPGREWAKRLRAERNADDIWANVRKALKSSHQSLDA